MAKLIWTEPALRQFEEIVDYIALDKPQAAQKIAATIFSSTDNVERFKFLGRSAPEFPVENYRQLWIKPCWIYYKLNQSDVYILHIRRAETPFRLEYLNED
jgi:plasmid stabilization system protein ParE